MKAEPTLATRLRPLTDAELIARRDQVREQLRVLRSRPGRTARNGRRALGRERKLIAAELDRRRRRSYAIGKAAERQTARNREPLPHLEQSERRRALWISGLVSMWERAVDL